MDGRATTRMGDKIDNPADVAGDAKTSLAPCERSPSRLRVSRDRLVRLAYRFVWNRDDAEDVVQEALARAHERASTLKEHEKWIYWVTRMVIHGCHLQGRRKMRRKRHEGRRATLAASHPRAASPAVALKEEVRASLAKLPRRQHEVVVLRHLEGMSYERIAELLGMAPATARVHAQAGRERLRTLLLERDERALEPPLDRKG